MNKRQINQQLTRKSYVASQVWSSRDKDEQTILMQRSQLVLAESVEAAVWLMTQGIHRGMQNSLAAKEETPDEVQFTIMDVEREITKLTRGITHYEDQPIYKITLAEVLASQHELGN